MVAAEFPELCEAETKVFAELLGTHVQRLATIAHGDHLCTTNVPHHAAPAAGSERKAAG
jgi:predicted ArsR family transcriptional regulator